MMQLYYPDLPQRVIISYHVRDPVAPLKPDRFGTKALDIIELENLKFCYCREHF